MSVTLKVPSLLLLLVLCTAVGSATPVMFSGSQSSLSAAAYFDLIGGDLYVTLMNNSTADVTRPTQVLTAVFFDITGDPLLSRLSATLGSGSTVWYGPSNGGNVGGEWAYLNALSGTPGGARQGISSSGLGIFGPSNLFPGPNLQGPASPDGLQYGITSAGDVATTGNTPVTGQYALIHNSVVFRLGNVPLNFTLSEISNVWFQYGTATTDTHYMTQVPEPDNLILLGAALIALGLLRRRTISASAR